MKNILTGMRRVLCALMLASVLTACLSLPQYGAAAYGNSESGNGSSIIVSLGDSYSSGEGIEPFYGQDKDVDSKVGDQDWLSHRSKKSWSGRLKLPGVSGTMSDHRNDNWYFTAVSGAETEHMNSRQQKDYSLKFGSVKGTAYIDPQLDIFDKLGNKKADYVTLTLGGNDAGFVDVITDAAVGSSYLNLTGLPDRLNDTWDKFYREGGIRDDLRKAYEDIARKAGPQARIIVAGYPQLLDKGGKGFFFSKEESNMIDTAVSNFNKEISNLISDCKSSGMRICFVSVEKVFSGHEAYTDDPYINKVIFGTKSEDLKSIQVTSAYSVHPNDKGAAAYAECVQKKIDQLETDGGASEWPVRVTSDERDIVLVLDTSGSMAGTPINETRSASEKFISTVLKEDASIGIVTYDHSASRISDFSMDEAYLTERVNNIYTGGNTNIEAGLAEARDMLSYSSAKKKIIVLMSDGAPNVGKTGDDLIAYADEIKDEGVYIYTLGFFENIYSGKSDEQQLMEAIASEGCHYEVSSADDLVFFFGDIADQLNGQKYIYIRIACPVDVTVTYKGEKLNSDIDNLSTRTDFGTLTFEEEKVEAADNDSSTFLGDIAAGADKDADEDTDTRIKILRLKEGPEYDIYISGNGKGRMDYTIGFMDDDGEYSDLRRFKNIKITKYTDIDTVAARNDTTVLNVDTDGDGEYDVRYRASANGRGEEFGDSYTVYILIAVGAVLVAAAVVIAIAVLRRKKVKNAKS